MDLDLDALRYEPLADRPSKVALDDLGRPCPAHPTIDAWIDALPRQLAGNGFRRLRDARIVSTPRGGAQGRRGDGRSCDQDGMRPVPGIDWPGRAGHPLGRRDERFGGDPRPRTGDRRPHQRRRRSATDGRHVRLRPRDLGTSSPPPPTEPPGTARPRSGPGRGHLQEHGGPGLGSSLLVAAYHHVEVPLTVQEVAIGTDIVHMTPRLDGRFALGKETLDDFRGLCRTVAEMAGGVWLNFGKRRRLARGLPQGGGDRPQLWAARSTAWTTANLDFNQQYRGLLNVLQRPGAEGIALERAIMS